jgi:hypothetical protein
MVKNWITERNITFKLRDVIKLTGKSFAAITSEDCGEEMRAIHEQRWYFEIV